MSATIFSEIVARVQNFCTNELGALYLDITKDRLYTMPTDSHGRRSAQSAMYRIAEALVRWLAPVLSFTAEEIWQQLPGERGDSVLFETWYEGLAATQNSPEQRRYWADLLAIRDTASRVLEGMRKAEQIGAALEAKLVIHADEATQARFAEAANELRFFFIVLGFAVRVTDRAARTTPRKWNWTAPKCGCPPASAAPSNAYAAGIVATTSAWPRRTSELVAVAASAISKARAKIGAGSDLAAPSSRKAGDGWGGVALDLKVKSPLPAAPCEQGRRKSGSSAIYNAALYCPIPESPRCHFSSQPSHHDQQTQRTRLAVAVRCRHRARSAQQGLGIAGIAAGGHAASGDSRFRTGHWRSTPVPRSVFWRAVPAGSAGSSCCWRW